MSQNFRGLLGLPDFESGNKMVASGALGQSFGWAHAMDLSDSKDVNQLGGSWGQGNIQGSGKEVRPKELGEMHEVFLI